MGDAEGVAWEDPPLRTHNVHPDRTIRILPFPPQASETERQRVPCSSPREKKNGRMKGVPVISRRWESWDVRADAFLFSHTLSGPERFRLSLANGNTSRGPLITLPLRASRFRVLEFLDHGLITAPSVGRIFRNPDDEESCSSQPGRLSQGPTPEQTPPTADFRPLFHHLTPSNGCAPQNIFSRSQGLSKNI